MPKKKKKKLTLQQMMWEDRMTAEDLANLSGQRPVRINVFQRAKKIKTWSRFVQLAKQENISPAEALTSGSYLCNKKINCTPTLIKCLI